MIATPTSPTDSLLQQAVAHFESNRLDKAEDLYQRILQTEPHNIIALNELGRVFLLQKKYDQAVAAFRKAISLQPDIAIPHKNLGTVLCAMGLLEESFAALRRHATLVYASPDYAAALQDERVAPYKTKHDQEQSAYLRDQTGESPPFVFQDAERIDGPALHPDLAASDCVAAWTGNNPKILTIDHFLTDEALHRLRQFCWGSTIWQRVYENGYLGASPEHGLGSPLLAQMIEELKTSLHPIMGGLPLQQFWAFKYDSGMKGINLHADFAAVNVNFWITPDEASLDPNGGGLIIWDKPAPLDWDFRQYNQNEDAGRAFLAGCGAKPIVVPHRCNRAVIFDSNLFHETDKITFKPGYLNRRINLTLLFGRREVGQDPS